FLSSGNSSNGVLESCPLSQPTCRMEDRMIRNLQEGPNTVEVQETAFSIDVLGRYICNTYDEAINMEDFRSTRLSSEPECTVPTSPKKSIDKAREISEFCS